MNQLVENIRSLVLPVLDSGDYHLLALNLKGHKNSQLLTVVVDTETGITMQEIMDLTRQIADVLDMEDPIPGKYRLEVTSPGTDWPLKETWQFKKNLGRELNIKYAGSDGPNEITGKLTAIENNEVVLNLKKKDISIPLSQIEKAVVKLKW